ncbi:MAG: hypothetical protein PHO08_01835 [Methylococcales bacterium]|nr:hypothetical protein [Methylococcales bacterium]MDD5632954.1 hypothetical protein [Methylococcales bacterium]
MTVDTRPNEGRLVDESFKKVVNYKLLAGCVHAELGERKHCYIQQIIRGLAFQLLYG